jgi:hypothetical protein
MPTDASSKLSSQITQPLQWRAVLPRAHPKALHLPDWSTVSNAVCLIVVIDQLIACPSTVANFASQSVVTISYKVPLQPLTATAICPAVEMPRKCLPFFPLRVYCAANRRIAGHQRSMWWTKPTFCLHLHDLRHCFCGTHSADNKPPWKLAIFALLGVRCISSSPLTFKRDAHPVLQ